MWLSPFTRMKFDPEVMDSIDMWTMLVCTVRYSMGRQTYLSSIAPELVERYNLYLSADQLLQIASEVQQELGRCNRTNTTLGSPSDHASWEKFARRLHEITMTRFGKSPEDIRNILDTQEVVDS